MTEATHPAKSWEGQIVDGVFPLKQFLGGTDHSAVFLTEYGEGQPQKAAIKLATAEASTSDLQLATWAAATKLSHPNLLRLFAQGRCQMDGADFLYLVMEHAEEDLADILPDRALTAEETRDMLLPVLDALEYLHGKGFVHRDLKPANILATGDQLKISSDAIAQAGDSRIVPKKPGVYDPPEAISGAATPAGDIWALGTTLVEVLTQHVPEWQPGPHREPVVPATLPAPFLEIARQCLRIEPDRRIRVVEIAAKLNPRAAAAAASVAMPGVSSVSPVTPTRVSAGTAAAAVRPSATRSVAIGTGVAPAPRIQPVPARPDTYGAAPDRPRFIVPLIVGALVFAVILVVPRLLTHRSSADRGATTSPAITDAGSLKPTVVTSAKSDVKPEPSPEREAAGKTVAPAPAEHREASNSAAEPPKTASEKQPKAAPPVAAQVNTTEVKSADAGAKPVVQPGRPGKGEVLDQVLPDVSPQARATIHGHVRIAVKVHVDAAGAVSEASLDSAGPSEFFADQALKAAKRWAFTPPEVDGKSVESDWLLHFVISQTDTKVTPVQTAP